MSERMLPVISVGISEIPNTASFSSTVKSMHAIMDKKDNTQNKGKLQLSIKSYISSSKKLKMSAQSITSKVKDTKPKPLLFNLILIINIKIAVKDRIKTIIMLSP